MICSALLTSIALLALPVSFGTENSRIEEAYLLELDAEVISLSIERLGGEEGARDGRVHALFARALYRSGREAESKRGLEVAVADEQSAHELQIARAWIALQGDDLILTQRLLTEEQGGRREALYPREPEACLLLGRALARGDDVQTADRFLRAFLELAPGHSQAASAWHMLAQHALRRGARQDAQRFADSARESGKWHGYYRARLIQRREKPDAVLPRLGLARLWLAVNDGARALAELEELLRRHPEEFAAQAPLARALHLLGDSERAAAAAQRALAYELPLARAELAAGDVERAERRLERLLVLDFEPELAASEELLDAYFLFAKAADARTDEKTATERHTRYVARGGTRALR